MKVKQGVILIVLLVLPAAIYLFFSTGRHSFIRLPIYGPRQAIEKQVDGKLMVDTLYHSLPDFTLIDQNGQPFSKSNMEGKIIVADFFFTTCKSICPLMTSEMVKVQEAIAPYEDVLIVSHTVNPQVDSPAVLNAYAQSVGALPEKWVFLSGAKEDLYALARNGYYISALEGNSTTEDFIHSEKFILLDKEKRIRGFYDGTDPVEVKKLMDEIKVLKASEYIPKKSKSGS